jgi:hypothetical protein
MDKTLSELVKGNRREEMKAVYRIIQNASIHELYRIIEEIRCVHDNIRVVNPITKDVCRVRSTCLIGESIQLNFEETDY